MSSARLSVGETQLAVVSTHLDHLLQDNRLPQIDSLLTMWAGQARTVIGGDFNAKPDSQEIALLTAAGLTSGQDAVGMGALNTYIALDPFVRLDYVFASGDIVFVTARVPASMASDHLPVSVNIRLR